MMDTVFSPSLSYPFESKMSKWCEQVIEDTSNWIQKDYSFLSSTMQDKYQRSNFGNISARCLPGMRSYRHLRVAAKFMLWGTIFDDYYEFATIDELKSLLLKVGNILDGNHKVALEVPLLRILCEIQFDLKQLMSDTWIRRFRQNVCVWIESMQDETPFKHFSCSPSIDYFFDLRVRTIGVQGYLDLIIMQLPEELPDEVMYSPYFKELYNLSARIFSWCNDFFSLSKDYERDPLNLVYVLQKQYQLDLFSAYTMAQKIHDNDLVKIIRLMESIPDYARWQNAVVLFVDCLKVMFRGQYDWYLYDTHRYRQ